MSDVADKWGAAVAQRGFAQIPNYLLLLNQFLDEERRLSPVELLVLLELVGTWWVKTTLPFPSMKTLATRCGVSDRQIQRAVNQLVKIGLLRRVKRRAKGIIASNAYDLAPLVALLDEVAKAYPNEFPRNIDRAKAREITERLNSAFGEGIGMYDQFRFMPEYGGPNELVYQFFDNPDYVRAHVPLGALGAAWSARPDGAEGLELSDEEARRTLGSSNAVALRGVIEAAYRKRGGETTKADPNRRHITITAQDIVDAGVKLQSVGGQVGR